MAYTKRRSDAPVGFFASEAAGLNWLAAAGPAAAPVAAVREVGDDFITLEELIPTGPSAAAAAEFGQALAHTHAAGAGAFGQGPDGRSGDGFIGRQSLTLRPTDHWGEFFAEQRLLPYARAARDIGNLSAAGAGAVDKVCERLRRGDFDDDRVPSRIHGDLWAGNLVFTDRGVVLIDPAAHGGDGLTDLAMLHLFGAPHLGTITASYAETAELATGWQDLIGLHQLHPLLVHAVSHSASYGSEAASIAKRYA